MTDILTKIGKLKNPNEIRVRGSQALHALAERLGWSSLAKLPSDSTLFGLLERDLGISSRQELLQHFRTRPQPSVFASFSDRAATVAASRQHWPQAETELVDRADRLVSGKFDLLGLQGLDFGTEIDWHLEPLAMNRASSIHWSKLDELETKGEGDKKIIWELNRHQYFPILGQAYLLTGDEKYAETFASHLESWMDANPPKVGINWSSSLEVAYRSIAWLWALQFFLHSKSLSASFLTRVLKFLYLSARHIETYLSTYFSPNTHLTGEALGLFYLGNLLPELKEAERWKETGKKILIEQLPIHVKADGTYFEQASYYHRYTADIYSHFLILARNSGESLPALVEEKLQALLDHLMYITRPDGTTPFFGDDDGGRLLPLYPRPANDFRDTLGTGAALFRRADYKFVAGDNSVEALWLLGPESVQSLAKIEASEPHKKSVAFPEGGYYVMRDGWHSESNYLLFDCGPHGTGNGGHAHADALSFELAANGRPILVDPGTFTYTGSRESRDWFRSSPAHNTLTLDGRSSSEPAGPFAWQTIAKCSLRNWISQGRFDFVRGQHDGFQRLSAPATHARSILFIKHDYWIMRDQLESDGGHRADVWFHFEPSLNPLIETREAQSAFLCAQERKAGLSVHSFGNGQWRREEAWVSHCYAYREPAITYAFSSLIAGNDEIITFLLPKRSAQPYRIREIEALGGAAFEVTHDTGLDIVMIRRDERVETARLASNFEWSWIRFLHNEDHLPAEFVLVGGQSLELEGRSILQSARTLNYLAASRQGDEFHLETDEGVLDLSLPFSDLESRFANLNRQSKI